MRTFRRSLALAILPVAAAALSACAPDTVGQYPPMPAPPTLHAPAPAVAPPGSSHAQQLTDQAVSGMIDDAKLAGKAIAQGIPLPEDFDFGAATDAAKTPTITVSITP